MEINFEIDENNDLTELDTKDLKEKIQRSSEKISKYIPEFFDFLTNQEKNGNYVEVHFPLFEFDLTLMISKVHKKLLISVLNHNNSIVYGNLILNDYPCIPVKDLKRFGDWKTFNEKKTLRIFKPL